MTIHPLAGPHYFDLLNHSWPSNRLVVSLISGRGYFTFLYKHAKQNIHNRRGGRKENKQTRTWVSSKHKKFVTHLCRFQSICGLSRACIRAKFSQTHQERWLVLSRWPTWPLSPQALALALFSWLPSSVDFFWLLFPADCPVLFLSVLLWDLAFPRLLPVS